MLKRWSVENFKSFRGRTTVDLGYLTVLCGANSSGKSSIIQSILLAKQTISGTSPERALALNGAILKLGRFEDVCHVTAKENFFGFSGEFDLTTPPIASSQGRTRPLPLGGTLYYRNRQQYETFQFEARLSVSGESDLAQLQPNLIYAQVGASFRSPPSETTSENESEASPVEKLNVVFQSRHNKSTSENEKLTSGTKTIDILTDEVRRAKRFNVSAIDQTSRAEVIEEHVDCTILSGASIHFFPWRFSIKYDANKDVAREIGEHITSRRSRYSRTRLPLDLVVPTEIRSFIFDEMKKAGVKSDGQSSLFGVDEASTLTLSQLLDETKHFTLRKEMSEARYVLSQNQLKIERLFYQHLNAEMKETTSDSGRLSGAVSQIADFLERDTKYLGPLRDEPRPLYPLEAISDFTDVGPRGEHTAAIFELNKNRDIDFIPPGSFADGNVPRKTETASLHDAVVNWLRYLGVASDIETIDKGKFGHEMHVFANNSKKPHDLTNVGVGVSQVLPIVIMSLLAHEGCMLIFEQPELHLHPKVQTRLGDFFIAMALQGKQCIVETHSEYMIERLRRRIAESEDDAFREITKIHFLRQTDGTTVVEPIEITRYGAIKEWPADFFDQSDRETEKILTAAATKRKRDREKRGSSGDNTTNGN